MAWLATGDPACQPPEKKRKGLKKAFDERAARVKRTWASRRVRIGPRVSFPARRGCAALGKRVRARRSAHLCVRGCLCLPTSEVQPALAPHACAAARAPGRSTSVAGFPVCVPNSSSLADLLRRLQAYWRRFGGHRHLHWRPLWSRTNAQGLCDIHSHPTPSKMQ
ncbi:hypothetical protein BC834DRAFT_579601 [Gloeopeniophorella convolvens]|nr:hypothetical protein BC834DRAFT_579601 [Gloeopeniophorella convolvens]